MALQGIKVTSYETDERWAKFVEERETTSTTDLRLWNGKILQDQIGEFDLAIVDGPPGGENREISTKIASEKSNLVLIHDAGRKFEKQWQEKYLVEKFKGPGKGGNRWHFWMRKEKAKEEEKKIEMNLIKSDKPLFRLFCNTRGDGGCGRSINWFMERFIEKGWNVEYVYSNPQPSGTYRRCGNPNIVATNNLDRLRAPCNVFMLASDDFVWEFKKDYVVKMMSGINAKRKVMYINYRIGEIGAIPWTQEWDKYIFLNSELKNAFESNYMKSKSFDEMYSFNTKVLAPPTDLTEYLKNDPDYSLLNIVRHSSQGDSKYAKDFNGKIRRILDKFPNATIRLMPGPSFLEDFGDRVIAYKKNNPPVNEFLKLGSVFWYNLPEGYAEGGPRVILEAMASGLSVVTGNHSGPRDRIIHGENGFLCSSFEEEMEAFRELSFEFTRRKMGEAAKEHARREFNPEKWITEIIGEER